MKEYTKEEAEDVLNDFFAYLESLPMKEFEADSFEGHKRNWINIITTKK
jgi:hypothetical protein